MGDVNGARDTFYVSSDELPRITRQMARRELLRRNWERVVVELDMANLADEERRSALRRERADIAREMGAIDGYLSLILSEGRELRPGALPEAAQSHRLPDSRTVVQAPPGHRLLTWAEFLYSRKTYEFVFQQAVYDMRDEYHAALEAGRWRKAKWVHLCGVARVLMAAGGVTLNGLLRIIVKRIAP